MIAIVLALLVPLVAGTCSPPTWDGTVCDVATKTCGLYPIGCAKHVNIQYFLSARSPLLEDGWTLLISPYSIACTGSECWTMRNFTAGEIANMTTQTWSVSTVLVPFSGITIKSAVEETAVSFSLTSATAAQNAGNSPLCSLFFFTGNAVTIQDVNITIAESCANATEYMENLGEDMIPIVFGSDDASNTVIRRVHVSGASTGILMRPTFQPMLEFTEIACSLPRVGLDGTVIDSCTAINGYSGVLASVPILASLSSFYGNVTVNSSGEYVATLSDYNTVNSTLLAGTMTHVNLSYIFSSYRQALTQNLWCPASSSSSSASSPTNCNNSERIYIFVIVGLCVFILLLFAVMFLSGHMRLKDTKPSGEKMAMARVFEHGANTIQNTLSVLHKNAQDEELAEKKAKKASKPPKKK